MARGRSTKAREHGAGEGGTGPPAPTARGDPVLAGTSGEGGQADSKGTKRSKEPGPGSGQ